MSTIDDLRNDLVAMRTLFELRFDQMKIEMKLEVNQLKAEMKTEMSLLNRRMDDLTGRMVELGEQRQQNPVDGGGGGQVNRERVDGAINNAGGEAEDGQEDKDDQQDAVSVKSEIDSGSCQSDCDYGMNEDIVVKEEVVDEDHGTGGQQHQEQAPFQPVAGPSGISRAALKRLQANPPRRSTRLASSQRHLNLSESAPTKRAHLRQHRAEKSHHCEPCNKRFFTNAELIQHRRHVHSRLRPYRCPHPGCNFAAASKGNLKVHLQSMKHRGRRK